MGHNLSLEDIMKNIKVTCSFYILLINSLQGPQVNSKINLLEFLRPPPILVVIMDSDKEFQVAEGKAGALSIHER